MKILVTGANGYIGVGVINSLAKYNFDIIATDIITKDLPANVKCQDTNFFELNNPYEYFGKPDIVLHLAWRNGFVHDSETHIQDLPFHYSFLSKMINSGVRKVVVMGSMHEIGFFEGRITENTPCNPQSLYGIAKNALRESVGILCKKNNTLFQWIRGYYIVGNSDKGSSIFSKITAAEKAGKKEFPFTTGINQYDFVDYDDFCNQVAAVCANDKITGIINACSGRPISLSERVEKFIKDNKYKIKLNYGAYPDRPYDSLALWGDNSKIQQILEENRDSY